MTKGYSKKIYGPSINGSFVVDFEHCNDKSVEVFLPNQTDLLTETEKFIRIGSFWRNHGFLVPNIKRINETQLLVEDLGQTTLLDLALSSSKYGAFHSAMESAVKICSNMVQQYVNDESDLVYQRSFDRECLLKEMTNFVNECSIDNKYLIYFKSIIDTILTNYSVIHRDYQSSNLILKDNEVYMIDFGDSCLGPRYYDIASLLYDCKICLSSTERKRLSNLFINQLSHIDKKTFEQELALTGLIRLLKSLTLRFKLYRNQHTSNNQNIIREIKRGFSLFNELHHQLSNTYGELLNIIDKTFNQFSQHNPSGISTIILGAGHGKRMGGDLPKVLQPCLGLPMIEYSLRISKMLAADKTYIVVGYKKLDVINYIKNIGDYNCHYVNQDSQLGTGHAVMQVIPEINNINPDHIILITAGDVPIIDYQMIDEFINAFNNNYVAGILTTDSPTPDGCGRIIRDANNKFIKTIEEKDIGPDQQHLKNINEISSGIMLFRYSALLDNLFKITSHNAQNEYYLPDVLNLLLINKQSVLAHKCNRIPEIHGANTPTQLKQIETWMTK